MEKMTKKETVNEILQLAAFIMKEFGWSKSAVAEVCGLSKTSFWKWKKEVMRFEDEGPTQNQMKALIQLRKTKEQEPLRARLAKQLEESGISKAAFARLVDVTPATVSSFLKGKNVSDVTCGKIKAALGKDDDKTAAAETRAESQPSAPAKENGGINASPSHQQELRIAIQKRIAEAEKKTGLKRTGVKQAVMNAASVKARTLNRFLDGADVAPDSYARIREGFNSIPQNLPREQDQEPLREEIQQLRAKVSLVTIYTEAGVSETTLAKLLKGGHISTESFQKLTQAIENIKPTIKVVSAEEQQELRTAILEKIAEAENKTGKKNTGVRKQILKSGHICYGTLIRFISGADANPDIYFRILKGSNAIQPEISLEQQALRKEMADEAVRNASNNRNANIPAAVAAVEKVGERTVRMFMSGKDVKASTYRKIQSGFEKIKKLPLDAPLPQKERAHREKEIDNFTIRGVRILKRWMYNHSASVHRVAKLLGVGESTIRAWLKGVRNMSDENYRKIMEYIDDRQMSDACVRSRARTEKILALFDAGRLKTLPVCAKTVKSWRIGRTNAVDRSYRIICGWLGTDDIGTVPVVIPAAAPETAKKESWLKKKLKAIIPVFS